MKYYVEESLSNFQFWSGGKDRAELLTCEQLDTVEQMMEEIEPAEGWTDTAINDFFWFEFDTIAQWLGYDDEEHLELDICDDEIQEAQDWFENKLSVPEIYELLNAANIDPQDFVFIDYDDEEVFDCDDARDCLEEWWDNQSDVEKVKLFRQSQ